MDITTMADTSAEPAVDVQAAAAIKYVVDITDVHEVALSGTANLAFWKDKLSRAGLHPTNTQGQATVVVSATSLKWMGLRFRELSLVVHTSDRPDGQTQDGVCLAYAYNSSAALAFMERHLFSTPYYPGDIRLSDAVPADMQLEEGNRLIFQATMTHSRRPIRDEAYLWEGPIYLLGKELAQATPGRFYARISGQTQIYPFHHTDNFWLFSLEQNTPFKWLFQSGFTPVEWQIRQSARHAKSGTLRSDP